MAWQIDTNGYSSSEITFYAAHVHSTMVLCIDRSRCECIMRERSNGSSLTKNESSAENFAPCEVPLDEKPSVHSYVHIDKPHFKRHRVQLGNHDVM